MPLIEVIANNTKTEKPGWAYVPDTGYDSTKAPNQAPVGARKRNARIQDASEGGLTARQSRALDQRLAELDKDNARDTAVPLPTRPDGRRRNKPKTAATKKILESQRTFAHYLAEEEALGGGSEQQAAAGKARAGRPKAAAAAPAVPSGPGKPDPSAGVTAPGPVTGHDSLHTSNSPARRTEAEAEKRLMQVVVPAKPSERLLEALTTAPPLSWNEARARPPAPGKPQRHFCELCGYWGKVRCLKCGARVCGLACKRLHDDSRCQIYGG